MARYSKRKRRTSADACIYTDRHIACDPTATRLYAARDATLKIYEIAQQEGAQATLSPLCTIAAPGQITDITCGREDLIVSAVTQDGAALYRLRGERLDPLADLPRAPRAVVTSGTGREAGVSVLLPPARGMMAEILHIDGRSGALISRREAAASVAQLRPVAGRAVLALDPQQRSVNRVDLNPNCRPERPGGDGPRPGPERPTPYDDTGRGCGCCPPPRRPIPEDQRPDPIPPRRPPPEYCEDGSDGTQDDCFVYVVTGHSITCRNICRPGSTPCRRHVHRRIERLELVGHSLFALSKDGRALTRMDARSLHTIEEVTLPRSESLLLPAPAAGQLLALAPDLSQLTVVQAAQSALDLNFDLGAQVSEKLIVGTRGLVQSRGPQFASEPADVLIVPVAFPGQNYTPANSVAPYRDALWTLLGTEATDEDAPLTKVLTYYEEQAKGRQDLSFTVFGADSGAYYTGGPIQIDQSVPSLYNGDFVAAGMQRLISLNTTRTRVSLRGNETREINAISSVNFNPDEDADAHHHPFTLRFPALVVRLNLDGTNRVQVGPGSTPWTLNYTDNTGAPQVLSLAHTALSAPYDQTFESAGVPSAFEAEVNELRTALNDALAASPQANDFEDIDVVWGKRAGETLGRLYILFRFAGGGDVPRFDDPGSTSEIGDFFQMPDDDARRWIGSVDLDPTLSPDDKADREAEFKNYLVLVSRLAEIAANADANNSEVREAKLGSATFSYGESGGVLAYVTKFLMSEKHGGENAAIEPGAGQGADPLGLADAVPTPSSPFDADDHNVMPTQNKDKFFEMVYHRIIEAVEAEHNGPPPDGWDGLATYLAGFRTIYTFPVDAPPPGASGAWSIDLPGSTGALRAFVRGSQTTNAPDDIGESVSLRWAMNFQSFDPVAPTGGISPRESDVRTFAHEIGHTLGLKDMYSSTKFDPTIQYMSELDLMGSSQANWSHLCAYHKLALGWWTLDADERDRLDPPAEDTQRTTDFILVPTEWWGDIDEADARAAVPGAPGDAFVTGVVLLNLNGDGGVLGAIEARAPGPRFSGDMVPDMPTGAIGRVTVTNILDYGENGRYGQIIEDTEDVPDAVVDGLLRYRRILHPIARNLQEGATFDFEGAPGFPYQGLELAIVDEGQITVNNGGALGSSTVPIYHVRVDWTGRRNPDVGFQDREVDWQSTDIAIDYTGQMAGNPQSGPGDWSNGLPQGVGDTVQIPPSGSSAESHQVIVQVHNFGDDTVEDVRVDLFLKDPGGAGDLGDGNPYRTQTIPSLGPVEDFGPTLLRFDWEVAPGQEPHVCWRAVVRDFRVPSGDSSQIVVSDASPTNNWAQQNIFESNVNFQSPPEPLESRFSVTNDGPFNEQAHLVAEGLPVGARLTIRPAVMRIPPYSQRTFRLRFEFDEDMIEDPCRREMDVLIRCIRNEEHNEELWGASLYKLRLTRKTDLSVEGYWIPPTLHLSGQIKPGIGVGQVSLRLDFRDGTEPVWISTALEPGGVYDTTFDVSGHPNSEEVFVMARYRGTAVFAPATSPTVRIARPTPAG